MLALASDRRIQALLIAFSFGAFIEGAAGRIALNLLALLVQSTNTDAEVAAGFGTPVAISAAMLIGLGFRPLEAAGLALIGNTAPVCMHLNLLALLKSPPTDAEAAGRIRRSRHSPNRTSCRYRFAGRRPQRSRRSLNLLVLLVQSTNTGNNALVAYVALGTPLIAVAACPVLTQKPQVAFYLSFRCSSHSG